MSPFKVIRCRYYADDGKAISPYCSAGRRCTFLHPGDKGWPGGDPSLEIGKRPEERERVVSERPHPRALKGPVNSSSYSTGHHKVFMPRTSINATTTATDIISETSHSPIRKTDLHTSTGQLPVLSIVQTFHDIAKFQSKITQDKEELTRAVEKLAAYRELLESLSTISVTSATAVRHTLDVITKARDHLEVKLQEDTKQLSGLWDEVFSVFLRAICRQFDNELEAGTDFLRHEARMLMKSFPKHFGIQSLTPNIQENRSHLHHRSQVSGGPDNYGVTNTIVDGKKSASKFEDEEFAVNPPIGSSDNGWGHKRRRISSSSTEEDTNADGSAWLNLKEVIVKMQRQLDNQDDKIKVLTSQNLALEQAIHSQSSSKMLQTTREPCAISVTTNATSQLSEDILSHIRQALQSDLFGLISPALEKQKQVNECWETRLHQVAEELKKVSNMKRSDSVEDIIMQVSS